MSTRFEDPYDVGTPSLAKSFAKCFGQDGAPKEFRSGFPLQVSGCSRVIFNGEYVQQGQQVFNLKIEALIFGAPCFQPSISKHLN